MVKTVAIITARGGSKRIPGKNIKEVIENYHKQGEEFELACNIYPTAPFITAKRLKEAYEIILAGECNAVFPVVQFSFPPQRGLSEAGGYLQPTSPDDYMKRSQDLQPIIRILYCEKV